MNRIVHVYKEDGSAPVKMWTDGVPVEEEARHQLLNLAKMPFIHRWVAAMPDVHVGIGATVGSVIATDRAIIPAAVGVDIGCGVIAARTPWNAGDLPDGLAGMRALIEAAIPHGRTDNGGPNDRGAWHHAPLDVMESWGNLRGIWNAIIAKHPRLGERGATATQLSTLGTGNHFIEVCLDEVSRVWVMLHSGSRGPGNRIGSYFIELAKKEMERYFISLPDKDLAYLPEGSTHFADYIEAVEWAQRYAEENRRLMLQRAMIALRYVLPPTEEQITTDTLIDKLHRHPDIVVSCHHNYVSRERHYGKNVLVTRKGAVRAREGDLGIIPGSMGTRSYIVCGKGNPESFHSCSHGAGRRMSRTAARSQFTIEDHIRATDGVECRKDAEVIDETPAAYKDIDAVMAAQTDLVEVVHTLRQIVCVKG